MAQNSDIIKNEACSTAVEKPAKKRKKVIALAASAAAACIALLVVLITVLIPSGKYHSAMELYDAGKYQDAYKMFSGISYKDSKDRASECLFIVQKPALSGVKTGDTIKFGAYEQDNNRSDGKEEIEWIVLDVEGNQALVISKYALDCKKYHSPYVDVTWDKCSLRKWLNDDFLNAAFGAKHQELIPSVSVSPDTDLEYGTDPGSAVNDQVFLLSLTEEEQYFTSDDARTCSATAYAKDKGAYTNGSEDNCWWWLRSPGYYQNDAAYIDTDGSVRDLGYRVNNDKACVRPAMWIKLGH